MSNLQSLNVTRPQRSRSKRQSAAKITNEGIGSKDWTIKGLPSETVDVTREAAKRSGMKINAWVSKALETAALSEPTPSAISQPQGDQRDSHILDELAKLRSQNDDLVQTINSMSAILLKMYTAKAS